MHAADPGSFGQNSQQVVDAIDAERPALAEPEPALVRVRVPLESMRLSSGSAMLRSTSGE